MIVQLSASLVKDFLSCPKKADFRINRSGTSDQTDEMATGSLVHEVLEKFWDDRDLATSFSSTLMKNYSMEDEKTKTKVAKSLEGFFSMFPKGFFSSSDGIEQYFKVPYKKGIYLTGKMDRVHNGIIYDWKTGSSSPDDINRDPQFIIYYMAYKKMVKEEPKTLCYVSLPSKKIYYFTPVKEIMDEFENRVIPTIVNSITRGEFPRNGLFDYKICERDHPEYHCPFQRQCWEEIGLKHE